MGTTSEELKKLYSNLGGDVKQVAKTQSPVEVLKKLYEYIGGTNPNAKNVQQVGDILNKFNEMDIRLYVNGNFYPPTNEEDLSADQQTEDISEPEEVITISEPITNEPTQQEDIFEPEFDDFYRGGYIYE